MTQQSLVKEEKGLLHLNGITASQILSLLEDKHSKDVFVPECKNGETWGARDLLKIDAWVLRRSYSPLTIIGYEIKTSRQDFEQDQKWTSYLDLCHEFFFVCPAGLIRSTDLPSRVGIIWASKDKLHTKHKAERIEPDTAKINRLLIYILMSRCKIVANMNEIYTETPKDKLQQLKEATEQANTKKELAYFIKGHIREVSEALHKKETDLSYRENYVHQFEQHLARLGITWNSTKNDWQDNQMVDNAIGQLKQSLDIWTLRNMKETARKMTEVADILEKSYNQKLSLPDKDTHLENDLPRLRDKG